MSNSTREQNEDLKSERDLETELIQYLPPLLNYDPRFLGFPAMEFFMLFFFCLVAFHLFIPLGILAFSCLWIFGKRRRHKSADWFLYFPYAVLRVPYAYLLPAGEKTFLP